MTSTTSTNEICKTDERGRVRLPRERREELLNEFENSGLSGMKFARLSGVKYATLANWVQKRREERAQSTDAGAAAEGLARPLRLFEAFVPRAGAGLTVELPGGGRLRIESPAQPGLAAELLGMLTQGSHRPC